MNRIEILAPAKLNLSLDIVGKRADGYHILDTVMQTIDIFDTILLEHNDTGILFECNITALIDESNIAVRASKSFFLHTGIQPNVKIILTKRIPMGAGMGGGSADGAAVLRGLNELFCAGLSRNELAEIGIKIGADIPFCVHGGTARVGGIGEIIEPILPLTSCSIVVAKPSLSINTKRAFTAYDNASVGADCTTDDMVGAVQSQCLRDVSAALGNAFMGVLQPNEAAVILPLIADLRHFGALNAVLTGSGSAVFGLFESEHIAYTCADALREKFERVELHICHPFWHNWNNI